MSGGHVQRATHNSLAIGGGRADIWQAHWLGAPPALLEFLLELEGDHCPPNLKMDPKRVINARKILATAAVEQESTLAGG
jgi:hypothetical protein